jgi:hypothetical protein
MTNGCPSSPLVAMQLFFNIFPLVHFKGELRQSITLANFNSWSLHWPKDSMLQSCLLATYSTIFLVFSILYFTFTSLLSFTFCTPFWCTSFHFVLIAAIPFMEFNILCSFSSSFLWLCSMLTKRPTLVQCLNWCKFMNYTTNC